MAHDHGSVEGLSTAPDVFIQTIASQVNQQDIDSILQAQKLMLTRFEKTNEMLINCNALSAARYQTACQEFKRHTQQLLDMKRDLDVVYRRVRNIRAKLANQYPSAFAACSTSLNAVEEDGENEASASVEVSEPTPPSPQQLVPPMSSSCSQTTTPSPVTSPSSSDTG